MTKTVTYHGIRYARKDTALLIEKIVRSYGKVNFLVAFGGTPGTIRCQIDFDVSCPLFLPSGPGLWEALLKAIARLEEAKPCAKC